jgi:hypothetical protein
MVVLGIDAHKRTHTVAVDAAGRQVGARVTRATTTADPGERPGVAADHGADFSMIRQAVYPKQPGEPPRVAPSRARKP